MVRDVWRQRVWEATPVIIVEHSPEWLIEHQVPGSVSIAHTCRGRQKINALAAGEWELAPSVVAEPGLNFYAAGGWSRVGMSWSTDFAEFHGWYVNLQMPLAPSRFGFDSMDLVLDARITPSGEWSWKDEDDFAEALDRGIFDRSIEGDIRCHGEAVAALLMEQAGPFHPRWLEWRPTDAAPGPSLPGDAVVI